MPNKSNVKVGKNALKPSSGALKSESPSGEESSEAESERFV